MPPAPLPPIRLDSAAAARLAGLCALPGGRDLSNRAAPPRLFSTWEIARYLIPMAPGHLRRVLAARPDLPQGQPEGGGTVRWFTLAEVDMLRAHFARSGSAAKAYAPYRPPGARARILTLANARTGSGKTTTALHMALAARLEGYRVLVIDLDPQARLSAALGQSAGDEWETALPLFARQQARALQAENRQRVGRGEDPVPLDAMLDRALGLDPAGLIRPGGWPGLGVIPAGLDLARAEMLMPQWQQRLRGWRGWQALRLALAEMLAPGEAAPWDLVVIDTPPGFGALTLAAVAAADLLLVPLAATEADLEGTGRFFGLLHRAFETIEARETLAARALGQPAADLAWPEMRCLLTGVAPAPQGLIASRIEAALGPAMLPVRQEFAALIAAGGGATIYGTDYRDIGRDGWSRARESFDASYAAIRDIFCTRWRQEAAEG